MEDVVKTKDEVHLEITESIKPRPWIRYLARHFDILTHSILLGIIWALINEESLDRFNDKVLSILTLFVWIFIEGIYLAIWGTTPGKKLLKIKLLDQEGNRLSKYNGFKRSRLVWFRGMGVGIGIIELIANIVAFNRLKKSGITSWDEEMSVIVYHEEPGIIRIIITILIIIGLVALGVIGIFIK